MKQSVPLKTYRLFTLAAAAMVVIAFGAMVMINRNTEADRILTGVRNAAIIAK